MPVLKRHDEQANGILDGDDANEMLSYLRRFKYASRPHIILEIFCQTGMRLGALRSLDVDDSDGENKSLLLEHRPGMDTPLKNGEEGERLVALTAETCRVIDDWMDYNRQT